MSHTHKKNQKVRLCAMTLELYSPLPFTSSDLAFIVAGTSERWWFFTDNTVIITPAALKVYQNVGCLTADIHVVCGI